MQPRDYVGDYVGEWKAPPTMTVLETSLQQPIGFVHFKETITKLIIEREDDAAA